MRRYLLAGISVVMMVGAAPTQAASPPNALVIGTTLSTITSLDPALTNSRTQSEVLSNLYDNLVEVTPQDINKIQPMLAEKWELSDDKRTIAIHSA